MSRLFWDAGSPANGQKVCLATTAYGGLDAGYTFSLARSRAALADAGIGSAYLLLSGDCHVDDARNRVVQQFLLSDCTDLVFLDADVSWEAADLVALCRFDADIVGGVYPYRRQNANSPAAVPVRTLPDVTEPDDDGLLEVEGLPTGFMRIVRRVLQMMAERSPSFWHSGDLRRRVPLLFARQLEGDYRWGGDIAFCRAWRELGGKVHAAANIRLGHAGTNAFFDSLGAALRRQGGTTIAYAAKMIREKRESVDVFAEAVDFVANPWGAPDHVLAASVLLARKACGDIIEAGSGLTTVLMAAAASEQVVYTLEHDAYHAAKLRGMAATAGVGNIGLCVCPLVDGWYDTTELAADDELPATFALGVVDGPPRAEGDRMGFFTVFGHRCEVIVADDVGGAYGDQLRAWAAANSFEFLQPDARLAVLRRQARKAA